MNQVDAFVFGRVEIRIILRRAYVAQANNVLVFEQLLNSPLALVLAEVQLGQGGVRLVKEPKAADLCDSLRSVFHFDFDGLDCLMVSDFQLCKVAMFY